MFGRNIHWKHFQRASTKVLHARFRRDSFIARPEAEHLAEKLHETPERIMKWFHTQRTLMKGTIVACSHLKERVD